MKYIALLLLTATLLFSCDPNKKKQAKTFQKVSLPYNFETPSEKYVLSKNLKEISGLSYFKNNQLVCVNDEQGKIFVFDIAKKEVVDKIPFGKDGDYEGVEVVDDIIYVLKSNGKLKGFKIGEPYESEIDCSYPDVIEYEGLGYNSNKQYLLLAAKERVKSKDHQKVIYAYDFKKKSLFKYIGIPEEEVTDEENGKEFKPSGIAVNPITGQIFILASDGKKLLVLAEDGQKQALISLNPQTYRQPEGICFSPEGDLFISSEGKGEEGYILKFVLKRP